MKSLSRLVLPAAVFFASVAIVAAQAPAGVLNRLEVQKLVAAETPEANATLANHFAALADAYAADATRHKDMALAFRGNSNRSAAMNTAAHCDRLAKLATSSAAASREMAAYHTRLAGGLAAPIPKGAAQFHGGEGAPEPTAADLHHLAMMARTPADHRSLEEYFSTLAKKHSAAAEEHVQMARAYRASVRKGGGDPASHCDRLARLSREAAAEATGAAQLHRQLANVG
jgi:hypothetical protein